jgi:hypothetical protein
LDAELRATGYDHISRLLADATRIHLDLDTFKMFWNDKVLIPASFKVKGEGDPGICIFFDGQTLRGPSGKRFTMCLCCDGGEWNWDCCGLGYGRFFDCPSAVLKP